MNAAKQRVSLRVGDVLGPGPAPDLDENTWSDPSELNPHYWGEVVVLVVVGEVVARESLPRGVVDSSKPLFVGKCFSLTSQPDHSQLREKHLPTKSGLASVSPSQVNQTIRN